MSNKPMPAYKANEIFNTTCEEIFFGVNFTIELMNNPSFAEELEKFLAVCKEKRTVK